MPFPHPSPEDETYWQSCRERKLVIRHCNACDTYSHPPMPTCPFCGSVDLGWRQVSGDGTVFSYTIAHHPVHAALKGHTPYNIAVVLLDGADDVRIVSNIVDAAPDEIHVGAPVKLYWDEIQDGQFLPRFSLKGSDKQDERAAS
jgi:uncharacterized OB-fold protein